MIKDFQVRWRQERERYEAMELPIWSGMQTMEECWEKNEEKIYINVTIRYGPMRQAYSNVSLSKSNIWEYNDIYKYIILMFT